MTEKEVRKLSRAELLEMLVEQGKQVEQLQKRIDELEAEIKDREIKINKAGSIAEAALSLNGIFEAAQASADQYIENLRIIYEREQEVYSRMKEADNAEQKSADEIK